MSLRGRYVIDRIKAAIGHRFKLPVPPYEKEEYWDKVYKSFSPDGTFEWGGLNVSDDLGEYEFNPHTYKSFVAQYGYQSRYDDLSPGIIKRTLAETLNLENCQRKKTLLLLGCGNSRMGEELIINGLVRGGDTLIQVDLSSKVVELMQERWNQQKEHYQRIISQSSNEPLDMRIIHDDARQLSHLPNSFVDAVIDKGLVDALHCCDVHDQIHDVTNAVHRVLKPQGGVFVTLSYSRPQFFLDRTLFSPAQLQRKESNQRISFQPRDLWKNIEIRAMQHILLYRYVKGGQPKIGRPATS